MNIILFLALLIPLIILIKRDTNLTLKPVWYVFAGGLILGGTGLFLGVLGAILLFPGNNLAPIIGFLFTGPLGFIIGLFAGYFYWKHKKNVSRQPPN